MGKKHDNRDDHLTRLPIELVEGIAAFCNDEELLSIRLVSKQMYASTSSTFGEAFFTTRTLILNELYSIWDLYRTVCHEKYGRWLRRIQVFTFDRTDEFLNNFVIPTPPPSSQTLNTRPGTGDLAAARIAKSQLSFHVSHLDRRLLSEAFRTLSARGQRVRLMLDVAPISDPLGSRRARRHQFFDAVCSRVTPHMHDEIDTTSLRGRRTITALLGSISDYGLPFPDLSLASHLGSRRIHEFLQQGSRHVALDTLRDLRLHLYKGLYAQYSHRYEADICENLATVLSTLPQLECLAIVSKVSGSAASHGSGDNLFDLGITVPFERFLRACKLPRIRRFSWKFRFAHATAVRDFIARYRETLRTVHFSAMALQLQGNAETDPAALREYVLGIEPSSLDNKVLCRMNDIVDGRDSSLKHKWTIAHDVDVSCQGGAGRFLTCSSLHHSVTMEPAFA